MNSSPFSGSWKSKNFKPYNFQALGIPPSCGHLHPLMKVRAEYRQIFLEMGFEEMPTNNYVESSFWNFDSLFQPQQHPARDAHDTFFIKGNLATSTYLYSVAFHNHVCIQTLKHPLNFQWITLRESRPCMRKEATVLKGKWT